MIFRLTGLVVSFGIVGYLLYSVLSSNSKMDEKINSNPTVIEQKQALESAGVNAGDKKELKKYLDNQAQQLEEYQHQADNLPKDP